MIKNYTQFLNENLQKAKSLYKQKTEDWQKIRDTLESKNRLGWMGKFTELLFSGVPLKELYDLLNKLEDLKLKNIIIKIDELGNYESILDEIDNSLNNYKFKAILNQLPRKQKDMVLENYKLEQNKNDCFFGFIKLYDSPNKNIFISKISAYQNYEQIVSNLQRFLSSQGKNQSREEVKKMLDDKLVLVFENQDIMILQTRTWEAVCKIGSDTSWCIMRSPVMFERYVKIDGRQFVLFDYQKENYDTLFKIGFTVDSSNQVTYAHDTLDYDVLSYTKELLSKNNVDLSSLGTSAFKIKNLESLDFENALKQAKAAKIVDKEQFKQVIKIIYQLYTNTKQGKRITDKFYDSMRLLFKKFASEKLGRNWMKLEEFAEFRQCFVISVSVNTRYKGSLLFENLTQKLMTEFKFIAPKKAPPDPFRWDHDLHWNYRFIWKYNIEKYFEVCIRELEAIKTTNADESKIEKETQMIEIVEAKLNPQQLEGRDLQNLISKFSDKMKILFYICSYLRGNMIPKEDEIVELIDKLTTENKCHRYKYLNLFDIKYKYDEECYSEIDYSLLIDEEITLKSLASVNSKLNYIAGKVEKNVIIDITKEHFLKYANQVITRGGKFGILADYQGQFLGQITRELFHLLHRKSGKVSFIEEVKFPITQELMYKFRLWYQKYYEKPVYVKVVIK